MYPSDHRLRDPDGLFCSQAGAGVFSAGAGKSTDIGSRGDADATIAACTKLIYETPLVGASQAAAYIARGLAYETEKDYDRAIADYSEAIQLGNKSALMYDTRGRAYLYAAAWLFLPVDCPEIRRHNLVVLETAVRIADYREYRGPAPSRA